MRYFSSLLSILFLVFGLASTGSANPSVIQRWLQTNARTQTLKVDFVQSRSLRGIKNPLVQPGTLWLDYRSGQFRWQLGDPAKTIVVSRGENQVAILRTPLKRVEYRDSGSSGSGSAGMSSLTHGFPKTMADFKKRYRILKVNERDSSYEIITQPLGTDNEGIGRFRFVIDSERFLLKGLVIDLKDGSTITTTFKRVDRNPQIHTSIFRPDLSEYRETKFRAG